ncbi:MAG: energy transducer TonB, partial [Gammaproteobacteria bacterium]
MPPLRTPPPVSSADRLSLTITLAIILHAIIILGVSFSPDEEPANRFRTLDVTLVHSKSQEAPDEATLLAQANQIGGGESPQPQRPDLRSH